MSEPENIDFYFAFLKIFIFIFVFMCVIYGTWEERIRSIRTGVSDGYKPPHMGA